MERYRIVVHRDGQPDSVEARNLSWADAKHWSRMFNLTTQAAGLVALPILQPRFRAIRLAKSKSRSA